MTEQNIFDDKLKKKSAFESNLELCDAFVAEEELEEAKKEWLEVDNIVPTGLTISARSIPVTYEEIVQFFKTQDMSEHLKNIKPKVKRKMVRAFYHWLLGPPKLKVELIPERNLVFAIAQYPYDSQNPLHLRLLRTLYKTLTGIVPDCPQFGNHWETIGFQGCNPSTDLRGVGFLGLFHLLYLVLNPKTSMLAKDIYKLSNHDTQHFPFCVMSINVTRIALESLREDILNREINKKDAVISVVNQFYAGCFYHLYSIWRQQGKTIMDSGFVIQDITKLAKNRPQTILDTFNNLQRQITPNEEIVKFSDIGDITFSVTL